MNISLWEQDTFDSADVIEVMHEVRSRLHEGQEGERDYLRTILTTLEQLDREGRDNSEDWEYGAAILIRDSYFTEYAQELADGIGAIPDGVQWPMSHIDWESAAYELKIDYIPLEVCGVTFWTR
jgi:hypothetical protein